MTKPWAERKPKKVDAEYLHRAALYYLQRFAATRARLGEVLLRKVAKRQNLTSVSVEAVRMWEPEIEKLLDRYEESGLLNDKVLAETRVTNLRLAGRSARDITNKMRQKGFDIETIEETLQQNEDESGMDDAVAIEKFMQKKKLGKYRSLAKTEIAQADPVAFKKLQEKEIAALMRAGFMYELIKSNYN